MAYRPERDCPVEAEGILRLDAPSGRSLELVADGKQVRLDVPAWSDIRGMVPRSFRLRRSGVRAAGNGLATLGLVLDVRIGGRRFLALGAGIEPSWLARLLGLAPANVPLSAIVTLLRGGTARDAA